MNSVKITYILSQSVTEIILLAAMFLAPTYLTPGWYFWSVLSLFLLLMVGCGGAKRMNSWGDFGKVD